MSRHTDGQLYLCKQPFVKDGEAPALKLRKTVEVATLVASIMVLLSSQEARAA